MYILGIETSCDETAAAVVKGGEIVLSNTVVTSLKEHAKFGGIIPEVASRRQLQYITAVVEKSLKEASLTLDQINAIAVTTTPGLIGSLLVGTSFAKSLSFSTNKKFIPVDHIKAHIYANFLHTPEEDKKNIPLPAIGLVVSGGHTSLYHIKSFNDFELIGQTRDDAAGEAFDKVAKVLNLGYPGGPVIEKAAQNITATQLKFKGGDIPESYDFSFSGIKTGVLYHHRNNQSKSDYNVSEVAFAFQNSVITTLAKKSIAACQEFKIKTLLIGGGVAANKAFRAKLKEIAQPTGVQFYFPPMSYCTDNAAMIAGLGFHFQKS